MVVILPTAKWMQCSIVAGQAVFVQAQQLMAMSTGPTCASSQIILSILSSGQAFSTLQHLAPPSIFVQTLLF